MTKPNSNRPTHTKYDSNHTAAASTENPIEQPSAANSKTKNSDTHQGITIKWSLDSASRRRFGLPPVAASRLVLRAAAGGAAWL